MMETSIYLMSRINLVDPGNLALFGQKRAFSGLRINKNIEQFKDKLGIE
jgi:hypothetical protein